MKEIRNPGHVNCQESAVGFFSGAAASNFLTSVVSSRQESLPSLALLTHEVVPSKARQCQESHANAGKSQQARGVNDAGICYQAGAAARPCGCPGAASSTQRWR